MSAASTHRRGAQPRPPRHAARAATALLSRENKRIVRQPTRVIATLGMGAIVWVLLGSGFAEATIGGRENYGAFMVPGIVSMIAVFSAVFAGISLIEDRHEGFLQSVLISPAPRLSIVAAKVLSAAMVGFVQALIVLPAGYLAGLEATIGGIALAGAAAALLTLGVAGLAIALAWRVDSVAGFHGVMNVVLMPMWLLSGSIFPIASTAGWLQPIMMINPLTWATQAMRSGLAGEPHAMAWLGALVFALGGVALAAWHLRRPGCEPR